jgi:hypothetical protein
MAKKRNLAIPEEGIEYDNRGRLKYHPEFHPNQGERLNDEELAYLCKFYEVDSLKSLSLALGRTERTLTNKVNYLRKKGLFDYYKKKWDLLYERG